MKKFLTILTFSIIFVVSNHAMEEIMEERHELIISINSVGGSDAYHVPLVITYPRNQDFLFECQKLFEKLYVAGCGATTALCTLGVIKTAQNNTDMDASGLFSLGLFTTITTGWALWYSSHRIYNHVCKI